MSGAAAYLILRGGGRSGGSPRDPRRPRKRSHVVLVVATALVVVVAIALSVYAIAASATGQAPITGKPAFTVSGPVGDQEIHRVVWNTMLNPDGYRAWLDGKPVSSMPEYAGMTQGFVIPVPCDGRRHWINLQGFNASGYGPLGTAKYFTTAAPGTCG